MNESKPKISVILPCYNVGQYIQRGLDSILSQTFAEWEAIMIDDGSTDETPAIIEDYASKSERFIALHTANQGVSCARNEGIRIAKGELLFFMDPDDWVEPNCFEKCWETYTNGGADVIHFNRWIHEADGRKQKEPLSARVVEGKEINRAYAATLIGLSQDALYHYYQGQNIWSFKGNWQVWCFMFRHSLITEHRVLFAPGVKIFQDALFVVEATIYARKIQCIEDVLYNYQIRNDGSVRSRSANAERLFNNKSALIPLRARLRGMVTDFDLHYYYLGSQVMSSLELCIALSESLSHKKTYLKYVNDARIKESIKKVCIAGAPLKFRIPVQMLKWRMGSVLFVGCWLLRKIGLGNRLRM
ncbi:MAG: glycosyltransferase [Bacteroidales bacterium]|nr:glycosyltransferase [Candidatus Physcousia equi]